MIGEHIRTRQCGGCRPITGGCSTGSVDTDFRPKDWPIDPRVWQRDVSRAASRASGFLCGKPGPGMGSMDSFIIRGGTRLKGKVEISGSKNSALPIVAAGLLTNDKVTLHGVPRLSDIDSMLKLVSELGCDVYRHEPRRAPSATGLISTARSISHVERRNQLRGPLRHRQDDAGEHLRARAAAGQARQGDRLHPRRVRHRRPPGRSARPRACRSSAPSSELKTATSSARSRRATQGLPDVSRRRPGTDRARHHQRHVRRDAGRRRNGPRSAPPASRRSSTAPTCSTRWAPRSPATARPEIRIEGVEELHGAEHRIIPDRIECGTFMIAAAITNGELELKNCSLDHLIAVVDRLEEVGVKIERRESTIFVQRGAAAESRSR